MHPILLKIGSFTIYTYGFLIATGIMLSLFVARKEAKRVGIDPDKITDLCFYLVISGVIGSRVFYVATNPEMFADDFFEIFRLWNGGLVFYGAFIGAFITGIVYVKKTGLQLWKTADICAPAVAIGHVLGRLGCFSAGCCYGKVCDLPWAVTFTDPHTLARPIGVALHPTQLYASGSNLIIFLILTFIRRRMKFDGQLFWIYVVLYGITRSTIEFFRADFRGGIVFGMFSISQIIGWSMASLAVVMLIILSRRAMSASEKNV
ncbi:MAG: prolipoprotein diacylglyceryl transferase [Deltaproteobacteria bacterium]|nr:prolipoprotein diacylglyceryl transferase [Deltaproteobacteria bacterium]